MESTIRLIMLRDASVTITAYQGHYICMPESMNLYDLRRISFCRTHADWVTIPKWYDKISRRFVT